MSWSRHLMAGFIELGHEAVVLSSTKSGRSRNSWGEVKWGNHWSVFSPELVVKDDNLVEALNSFDLIVLPEPKVPGLDKEAMKFKDEDGKRVSPLIPVYVDALQRTSTPFIFALHGNDYDEKSAPFMDALMMADSWSGVIISHSERSTSSNPRFSIEKVIHSPLPYAPSRAIDAPREYAKTVGTTGRFIFNKGPHLVALAAGLLEPSDATVELWGSAAAGLGASTTFVTYEALLASAEKYARYGDQEAKKDDPRVTEHGNTIRPYLWDVRLKTGQLVRYLGNYTDPVAVSERLAVHVNLTGYKFSGGLVEYSTLEAMDAGSFCIVPPHVHDSRFMLQKFELENPPGTPNAALKQPELLQRLATTINEQLEYATTTDPSIMHGNDTMREINRNAIREVNNPATIAQTFIDGAFSK